MRGERFSKGHSEHLFILGEKRFEKRYPGLGVVLFTETQGSNTGEKDVTLCRTACGSSFSMRSETWERVRSGTRGGPSDFDDDGSHADWVAEEGVWTPSMFAYVPRWLFFPLIVLGQMSMLCEEIRPTFLSTAGGVM